MLNLRVAGNFLSTYYLADAGQFLRAERGGQGTDPTTDARPAQADYGRRSPLCHLSFIFNSLSSRLRRGAGWCMLTVRGFEGS